MARGPLLLQMLPGPLRGTAFHRLYRADAPRWRGLYTGASLRYAPGVKVDLLHTDFMHAEIAFTGCYEPETTKLVCAAARAGGVFVDAGANIGYFSLIWAAQNPANKVFAFEAAPRPGDILVRNVEQNGLARRVVVSRSALGAKAGKMAFDKGPETLTGWGGLSLTREGGNIIEVEVQRLDEALPDTPIDLLKIDVEGADTWVLHGAKRLLEARRVKRIIYEQNHPRMRLLGIEAAEASALLGHLGYKTEAMRTGSASVANWLAVPM